MDRSPVRVVHLVKLVDETGALVGENERATFESPFASNGILANAGRKTDRRCALARSEHRPMSRLLNVLQELRFGRSRITKQQYVDVATDSVLALDVLRTSTEKGEGESSFDVFVTVDGGRDRFDDAFTDAVVPGE